MNPFETTPADMAQRLSPAYLAKANELCLLPQPVMDILLPLAQRMAADARAVEALAGYSTELLKVTRKSAPVNERLRALAEQRFDDTACMAEVLVMLAGAPSLHERNLNDGYPEELTAACLEDLALWLSDYHQRRGRWALFPGHTQWISNHFTGRLFKLGRLQFEFIEMGMDAKIVSKADGRHLSYRTGDTVLGVHIPAGPGMTPQACGDSVRRAKAFFPRYFPQKNPLAFHCSSWLLDPVLSKVLPKESNIAAFQRPFSLYKQLEESDAMWDRVFLLDDTNEKAPPPEVIAKLPRDTALRKALLEHVEAGGKLGGGTGIVPWDDVHLWEKLGV